MRVLRWMLPATMLFVVATAGAQVIEETGSLRNFLAGQEPAAAYDNWVSHVVEGIADPGYNDYGPAYLDPQTNGFGQYRLIPDTPAADATIAHWRQIFERMLAGDLQSAAALVADSAATFHYETVRFTDTEFGREYWMIREQLDPSFVDDFGTPGDPADDIIGSFRNGWGVFVFNPEATRDQALVQVVHPTDDFFAPIASIELFFRLDAAALSINGAGREVRWTELGNYANGKSLSDPSRYPRHPVQLFHEAFAEARDGDYPRHAQVVQLHSFDPSHNLNTPNILSAGYYRTDPTLPLRDNRHEGRDIPHLTQHPVFQAGDWIGDSGPLGQLPVNQYYALNTTLPFYVNVGPDDSLLVPQATTLRADPDNQQVAYFTGHDVYHEGQSIEPFLHVEMDEFPAYLEDGDVPRQDLFDMDVFPPEFDTYLPMLTFYEPFLQAVENWFIWQDDPFSTNNPPDLDGLEIETDNDGSVRVRWPQVNDGHHLTYEIVAAETPPNESSPVVWNALDDPMLRVIGYDDWTTVTSLPTGGSYYVAARLRDLSGNRGALSPALPVNVTDTQPLTLEFDEFSTFPVSAWPLWFVCHPEQDDVGEIAVLWRLNGGETQIAGMSLDYAPSDAFSVPLPDDLLVQAGDVIEWRFRTHDLSITGNEYYMPEEGFYSATLTNGASRLQLVDFETPSLPLVLGGDWERGVPTSGPQGAVSGENVLATTLDGAYQFDGPGHAILENAIRPEYGPLLLTYKQWIDYQAVDNQPGWAVDGGRLRTEGNAFDVIEPIGGYTHRIFEGPGEESRSVFSGSSGGWETVVVDLKPRLGDAGYIQFTSETAGETGHAGWYIDDVQLLREVNQIPPAPFTLLSPEDGAALEGPDVTFSWEATADSDPYAIPLYELALDVGDSTLVIPTSTQTDVELDLQDGDLYENGPPEFVWSVRAISQGDTVWSSDSFTLLNPFSAVDEPDELPGRFALREVWPNPFNAELSLRYDLPARSPVHAALYNVLGQQVAVIERGMRPAGRHRVQVDAGGLASGVYLLRLQAGDQTAVRKVVLVR